MSEIKRTRHSQGWLVWYIPLMLLEFGLLIKYLIHDKNVALFNPKGYIAEEQLQLIIYAVVILLAVALPTLFLLYFTAWKYRESNTKAVHDPNARQKKSTVCAMWLIPSAFMLALALIMWPATHKLEPNKLIAADVKPMTIQVVSMQWKWVFIYPEQKIATVNFVQLPVGTPVTFELTGDEAPMSSFWIPNLGGQLYSMTSHVNTLNLMADTPGDYPGSTAEINGAGFSGMRFTARASSVADFDKWVDEVKQSPDMLDTSSYDQLLKPSRDNPVAYYSNYQSDLYDRVIRKYSGAHDSHNNNSTSEGHE